MRANKLKLHLGKAINATIITLGSLMLIAGISKWLIWKKFMVFMEINVFPTFLSLPTIDSLFELATVSYHNTAIANSLTTAPKLYG